jgi:hypothetical protein
MLIDPGCAKSVGGVDNVRAYATAMQALCETPWQDSDRRFIGATGHKTNSEGTATLACPLLKANTNVDTMTAPTPILFSIEQGENVDGVHFVKNKHYLARDSDGMYIWAPLRKARSGHHMMDMASTGFAADLDVTLRELMATDYLKKQMYKHQQRGDPNTKMRKDFQ